MGLTRSHTITSKMMRQFWSISVIVSLITLGAGCNFIDRATVEADIQKDLSGKIGFQIESVTCPERQLQRENATFQCDVATADRQSFQVEVTQLDNEGTIQVNAQSGIKTLKLSSQMVEEQLIEELRSRTGWEEISASCPEAQPIQAEATFACSASAPDGQEFRVDVTQEDNQGNIRGDIETGLWTLQGLIDNQLLAQQITDGILVQTGIEVTTSCGPTALRIALQETTFSCTTTDSQQKETPINVRAKDNNGNVAWEI